MRSENCFIFAAKLCYGFERPILKYDSILLTQARDLKSLLCGVLKDSCKQSIFYFIWRTCCPTWCERGTNDLVQCEGGGVGVLVVNLVFKTTFWISCLRIVCIFSWLNRESSVSNLMMNSIGQKNTENLMLAQINFCCVDGKTWKSSVELRRLFQLLCVLFSVCIWSSKTKSNWSLQRFSIIWLRRDTLGNKRTEWRGKLVNCGCFYMDVDPSDES